MHIHALTKKSPDVAEVNGIVFFLDIISAILSVIYQVNALIINIRSKNTTTT